MIFVVLLGYFYITKVIHLFREKFETFTEMLDMVAVAWQKASLVHADLSEYNILWHEGEPWFIDIMV